MSLPPESNPYASPRTPGEWHPLAMAAGWSLVAALAGGFACGWCVSHFGEFGALSLAACGAFAGYVSRRITQGPSKAAGICVVVAACLMYFIAETCWIHWNTEKGGAGWWAAITLWPLFIRDWQLLALIGALFAGYGAWCAYGYATNPSPLAGQPASPAAPPPSSSASS